jgi:hypothetical protein
LHAQHSHDNHADRRVFCTSDPTSLINDCSHDPLQMMSSLWQHLNSNCTYNVLRLTSSFEHFFRVLENSFWMIWATQRRRLPSFSSSS